MLQAPGAALVQTRAENSPQPGQLLLRGGEALSFLHHAPLLGEEERQSATGIRL